MTCKSYVEVIQRGPDRKKLQEILFLDFHVEKFVIPPGNVFPFVWL